MGPFELVLNPKGQREKEEEEGRRKRYTRGEWECGYPKRNLRRGIRKNEIDRGNSRE
jgi:hypothetical protein